MPSDDEPNVFRMIVRELPRGRVAFVAIVVLANLTLGSVARGRRIAQDRAFHEVSDPWGGNDLFAEWENYLRTLAADPVIPPWRWTREEMRDTLGWPFTAPY
ncbi:MAG: hypothetical protein ACAI25_05310 [Planctomycetota bacterium]